jgi:hypothetical protein
MDYLINIIHHYHTTRSRFHICSLLLSIRMNLVYTGFDGRVTKSNTNFISAVRLTGSNLKLYKIWAINDFSSIIANLWPKIFVSVKIFLPRQISFFIKYYSIKLPMQLRGPALNGMYEKG